MDMELASLGVAFTAGMLAVLAPCALPMLPSYVAYYMNLDEDERSLGASLGFSFTVVAGFLVVFIAIGILPSFALNQVSSRLEYVAPFIGALLVLIGLASGLSDVFDRIPAVNVSAPQRAGYRSFFLYGVGYGAASLACSLPVFILLVLQSTTVGGPLGVFKAFLAYGLGASAVIVPLTLALTYSKDYVHQRLVWLLPRIKRINAAVLILAGLYMIINYFV
jgi:cytochrome c biogenesis protein CcdA